jgi:eukaryotic-like serine/threonine-protein kinase
VKVLDFGVSKAPVQVDASLTDTNDVLGTPAYMSPEQMKASRDVDARTDIWALGVVLYECLTGARPFEAESFSALVLKTATEPAPSIRVPLPRGLEAVVRRCMEKDRRARYATMAELAAALQPFASDQRAAAVVVDRTRAMMSDHAIAMLDTGEGNPVRGHDTTLGASVGVVYAKHRRGTAIGGAIVAIGAAAVIVSVSVRHAGRGSTTAIPSAQPAAAPLAPAAPVPTVERLEQAPDAAPASVQPPPPQVEPTRTEKRRERRAPRRSVPALSTQPQSIDAGIQDAPAPEPTPEQEQEDEPSGRPAVLKSRK